MSVKVTGQFVPAGDFAIVDGKDVSGNITGSNVSASGTGSFGRVSTATFNSTGNIDIGGNLTVTGNYTVNGTTTFISSSQLDIGDNIIHLNSVSPVRYAGIHVRDIISTTNTGSMVWDSTNDYWLAGQSGSEYRVPLQDSTSNLTDNRIIIAQANGRLEAGNITDTGASISTSLPITASSNLEVAGNVSGSSTSTGSFGNIRVGDNTSSENRFMSFAGDEGFKIGYAQSGFLADDGSSSDGVDAEIVMTGNGGSAPFNQHGSIVYKTRAVDAIA